MGKCGLMGKGPKGEAGTLVLGQGTSYLSYTGLSRKQQEGPGAFWVIPVPGSDQV